MIGTERITLINLFEHTVLSNLTKSLLVIKQVSKLPLLVKLLGNFLQLNQKITFWNGHYEF